MEAEKSLFAAISSWTPPAPPKGSRAPSLRSAGTSRSILLNTLTNCESNSESDLEKKHTFVFQMRPDVVDVIEQQPVVTYCDEGGICHRHTFDLLVIFKNGTKVAYAIKPWKKALQKDFRSLLKLIARQTPATVADAVALLTERHLQPWAHTNAILLHSAARGIYKDKDAIAAVRAAINGSAQTIGAIVEAAGLRGRAFRAILRLVVLGELSITSKGRITYATIVSPTAVAKEAMI